MGKSSGALLSGAIFTTTPDGSIVNENVRYDKKIEVYLDGGPGPNAPKTAAGLPDGNYYFQVTDPSGKVLLSEDPAICREVRVEGGVIVALVSAGRTYQVGNKTYACTVADGPEGVAGASGRHDTNVDVDYGAAGAIVIQLMPFFDTPNPGGVYKAWMIQKAVYDLDGDPTAVPSPLKVKGKQIGYQEDPGFGDHSASKTDNFKVKRGKPCDVGLTVKKFHDANLSGVMDVGEEEILGWTITIDTPVAGEQLVRYTPVTEEAQPAGTWKVTEDRPAGTLHTVSFLDGAVVGLFPASPSVDVNVAGVCGETHQVVFGNAGIGEITACKTYDRNADGVKDAGEPGIAGWKIQLQGIDVTGASVGPVVQTTGADGCTTFADLRPGNYTVNELMPSGGAWYASGAQSQTVVLESKLVGGVIVGDHGAVDFLNYCTATADFGTKGYWHNKNGLDEFTDSFVQTQVNPLSPYATPSTYFDAGDEAFDGFFTNGTPVAAANPSGELIAPAGSLKAEVSHFLVDANASGDPREQLAQQLLAFIFNVQYRLGAGDVAVQLADGTWTTGGALISTAIGRWESGTAAGQDDIKTLLDTLNNNDFVPYIPSAACSFSY